MRRLGGNATSMFSVVDQVDDMLPAGPIVVHSERAGGGVRLNNILHILHIMHIAHMPDKIARFLYEYHDSDYLSLDLPPLELDRSDTDVHGVLKPYQVDNLFKYVEYVQYTKYVEYVQYEILCIFCIFYNIMHIQHILHIDNLLYRIGHCWTPCVCRNPTPRGGTLACIQPS